MEGNNDVVAVLIFISLLMLVALWVNWIFIGPDGYTLAGKDRPSLWKFYKTLVCHPIQTFEGRIFWPEQPADDKRKGAAGKYGAVDGR